MTYKELQDNGFIERIIIQEAEIKDLLRIVKPMDNILTQMNANPTQMVSQIFR